MSQRVAFHSNSPDLQIKGKSEYSKMCDADVCVGIIRLREPSQVFILSADAPGFWAFFVVYG
ncbi:unnamed protein product [Penicillium roqueforti FM164]|uniref:Uncharacterized protein n=1 Tax=Penicillium roqueforti (strain FM164) TaxID=1365484 RepID=W6QR18_PENRF|nr:unnamed protein product [Penicillium roqueforti FM164]